MNLAFAQPWLLPLAALALLPLWRHGVRDFDYPDLGQWPNDPASRAMAVALRLAASLAVLVLVLACAGPYLDGGTVTRTGHGAQIVVVLDRSGSMSERLAVSYDEQDEETKIGAARRLLLDFMAQRPGDMFGVVAFGSSPIAVAPLSEDRDIARAALASAEVRSFGFTAVARALAMALEYYGDRPYTGSRLVLLVSDGGADIAAQDRDTLDALFREQRAGLVWIYTRGAREDSVIAVEDADDALAQGLSMHRFFRETGVPYQVFEATDAEGLRDAVSAVGRMTHLPTRYAERLPRRDLAGPLFAFAGVLLLLLALARAHEVPTWVA